MHHLTKPYFIQTQKWADFWVQTQDKNHSYRQFTFSKNGFNLQAIGYKYPWQFGQSFYYFPRFCSITSQVTDFDRSKLLEAVLEFIQKITTEITQENCTFIKIDTGFDLPHALQLTDTNSFLTFIKNSVSASKISAKSLQYLATMVLDTSLLTQKSPAQTYLEFYESNKLFWSKCNENVRRYTKKSTTQNWNIDTSVSHENFEKFWHVYEQTAKRQEFGIHPKNYFETMLKHNFVRLITLSDENGPQSVWFGVSFDDTMYYLYGGNTEVSFKKYGQYLVHLVATEIIARENLKKYDLGGYDSTKGFGKFKDGYRGEIVHALGPIDIILDKPKYTFTQHISSVGKNIKKILRG
jgi:lipid II:glycine glycyltransferase (peptidoglycan interpeptide bridge formation enzyme)